MSTDGENQLLNSGKMVCGKMVCRMICIQWEVMWREVSSCSQNSSWGVWGSDSDGVAKRSRWIHITFEKSPREECTTCGEGGRDCGGVWSGFRGVVGWEGSGSLGESSSKMRRSKGPSAGGFAAGGTVEVLLGRGLMAEHAEGFAVALPHNARDDAPVCHVADCAPAEVRVGTCVLCHTQRYNARCALRFSALDVRDD